MNETRDDLREALDDLCDRLDRQNTVTAPQACADTMDEARVAILSLRAGLDALVEANAALATGEWTDVRQLEAEAQVSALQAEVEEARQDAREAGHNGGHLLHQLDQAKVEIRRLSAEVERLQKVEGEREKGRVPSGPCWSDKPEPQSVSALRATITSRGPRWHDQTILHSEATRGNCMQAAVASILGLSMRDVPHFAARPDRAAHLGLINFAASHGFDLVRDDCHKHFEGLYLGCGPTARGTHHMVVMRDGEVFHDPHPSRGGLHSVEFVYTFLPLDPATHVAACEAVKTIPPLLAKASAGPWSAESLDTEDGWGPCRSSEIQDAAGKTVLDALNSGVACMAEEADEDGRVRYDEQGAADAAYVVALDSFARRLVSSAPCGRPPKGEDPQGLSAEQARAVTGVARQAPSDNPLTETKEGSER